MIFIDYLYISFLKIRRSKSNKFLIIITLICSILALSSLTFLVNIMIFIDNSITKNIGFRTFDMVVETELNETEKQEILNIKHIDDIYSSSYEITSVMTSFASDNHNGYVGLSYGGKASLPQNIIGEKFTDQDRRVAICPINFYPDDSVYNLKVDKNNIINGTELIGEKFTVYYYSYEFTGNDVKKIEEHTKEFEIIGTYNNEEIMYVNNQCFIPFTDLKEIIDTEVPLGMSEYVSSYYVVVDDIRNLDYVLAELQKLGFENMELKNKIDSNMVNTIQTSCVVIVSLTLFAIVILTISYIKKKLYLEEKYLGMLRTVGYTKDMVNKIYLLETLITNVCIYLISLFIFIMIFIILKTTLLVSLSLIGVNIIVNFKIMFFTFIISVVFPLLISQYYVRKKNDVEILKLMNEE